MNAPVNAPGVDPAMMTHEAIDAMMQTLAWNIDRSINGDAPIEEKKNGFCLIVFPLETHMGNCNYISNATKEDIVALFKCQLAKWDGNLTPERWGRA